MKTKLIVLLFAIAISAFAEENVGSKRKAAKIKSIAAGCAAPSAKEELDINNVRTTILDAGDLWWNAMAQQGPQYEIPKDGKKHSIFAGSLWVGGIDASGNLRMAAQTYRQTGIDFWPGPVDIASASTDPGTCLTYDKLWKITYQQIKDFKDFTESNPPTGYTASSIPDVIKTWPGNVSGNPAQTLAPFIDVDGNGIYDYSAGDYPDNIQLHPNSGQFYCDDCTSHPDILFGDQSIWWVFNDVGNIHTETGGATIGIEVHAQAFGFATNDEINNMTFYKYKIINRSSAQLNQNYFGVFVDADLGYAYDDYVGCDVPRGLGYCYNGDDDDQGPSGYGFNPPAVGMDFFQGPKADPTDTSYTDRNCGLDPHRTCKQLIMSRFIYFNNQNSPPNGNPFTATEYYGYLKGIWKNGVPMTYGGDGIGGGNGATNIPAKYMFPGNTDHQYEWGTGGSCNSPATAQLDWNEVSAGTVPDDRRFLQSAGPFTLKPGAVNYVTTGVVWARATQGGPLASVNLLRITDDKAQALFNNCFQILNGPDAPDVSIRELDKEIILSLSNALSSNNYKEQYFEIDPFILNDSNNLYRFQGYQIFQIINQSVATTDLHNTDKARLIAEVDIKDGVAQIVNHYPDNTNSTFLSVTEAEGSDKGIRHSFRVLTDAFASGATRLINHKNYFYMVIAYGFNAVEVTADPYDANHDGHAQPFIAGRRNVKVYTAIPHIPSPENYGQVLNSIYGAGPKITRVEGTGNGFVIDYDSRLALDLTPETVNQILSSSSGYWARHPEYENGRGPVNIKVYDPVRVQKGQFKLWLDSKDSTSYWNLEKLPDGDTIRSTTNIVSPNEQLFPEYGLSINVTQVLNPLSQIGNNVPGFVEATKTYEDPTKSWLSGVPDADGIPALDWIISAATTGNVDPTKTYDKILGGTWAPYRVCAITAHAPGTNKPNALSQPSNNFYQNLPSIDLVLTRDISKWSKCVVVEANADSALVHGVLKGGIKKQVSLDMDGNTISGDTGRSYFPGYAINVETGERLNIMFAEDSWLVGENGNDMKWNPTSGFFTPLNTPLLGGKHFIYVVNANHNPPSATYAMNGYDGCDSIQKLLLTGTSVNVARVYRNVSWVGFPLLLPGQQLLSNDVKIRLRVTRAYQQFGTGTPVADGNLVTGQTYIVQDGKIKHNGIDYSSISSFTAINPNYTIVAPATSALVLTTVNNGNPMYTFSTDDLFNDNNNLDAAKSALDLINVVPNPYYAYSGYEGSLSGGVVVQPQLDNRIKIVNLPPKCVVSIYTVSGILVRKFSRDVAADNSPGAPISAKNFETSQDWDLKNHKGVPIASGLYLIHVEAAGIGERTLKWFGVMRPIDLDSF